MALPRPDSMSTGPVVALHGPPMEAGPGHSRCRIRAAYGAWTSSMPGFAIRLRYQSGARSSPPFYGPVDQVSRLTRCTVHRSDCGSASICSHEERERTRRPITDSPRRSEFLAGQDGASSPGPWSARILRISVTVSDRVHPEPGTMSPIWSASRVTGRSCRRAPNGMICAAREVDQSSSCDGVRLAPLMMAATRSPVAG